ncbi:MAG: RNA polymerase subunit sigma [Chlorobiaceae bacterium]|nr:RNA polymerase subunit sigma [Chlorobiaceae bacterium]MBA4309111.1 RNA polymerase subunit sigma [Chlorobiaceae bacterium]
MTTQNLWHLYKTSGGSEVKKQIMMNYTNLVHYVIHNSKFINYDVVDERDYFQFGIEGLSEAIERFDYNYGTKFETYAIQRIRGKIIDELRKLQAKQRIALDEDSRPIYASSLSLSKSPDGSEDSLTYNELISNEQDNPQQEVEKTELKEILFNAIKELKEKERLVISLYYYEDLNYKEIAEVMDITVSRVSQIHTKVIEFLRKKTAIVHA